METEIFFPLGSTGRAAEQTAKAKAICAGCEVREQCLECALDEPAGVWGGKTEEERQALRRSRQRQRKTPR
jgi:WhiB family transcriptional regulator, redox-sensing transcriptional regulator